jgi:CDP-diacylglycerol--serine O-phosphatidyltransferase
VLAGVLDGMDGRIARLLKGQSRFGAELDSLSDVIAFGVAPAIIMDAGSLQFWPRFGWLFALAYAVCAALRLARFNANIDARGAAAQIGRLPDRRAGAGGAGLMLLPLFLWLWRATAGHGFHEPGWSRPGRRWSLS